MASKYPTAELVGVVMTQTNSGQYEPKETQLDMNAFHVGASVNIPKESCKNPANYF